MSNISGNNNQPSVSPGNWSYIQDKGSVKITVQQGSNMLNALNQFFSENSSVFTDENGDGLTSSEKQKLYEELVNINNEKKYLKDVNSVKPNQGIYVEKEDLERLAAAAGYKINNNSTVEPEPEQKASEATAAPVTQQKPDVTPTVPKQSVAPTVPAVTTKVEDVAQTPSITIEPVADGAKETPTARTLPEVSVGDTPADALPKAFLRRNSNLDPKKPEDLAKLKQMYADLQKPDNEADAAPVETKAPVEAPKAPATAAKPAEAAASKENEFQKLDLTNMTPEEILAKVNEFDKKYGLVPGQNKEYDSWREQAEKTMTEKRAANARPKIKAGGNDVHDAVLAALPSGNFKNIDTSNMTMEEFNELRNALKKEAPNVVAWNSNEMTAMYKWLIQTERDITNRDNTAKAADEAKPAEEKKKAETPPKEKKVKTPKEKAPKEKAPKAETPKVETPKVKTPKVKAPKVETPKAEKPAKTEKPAKVKQPKPAKVKQKPVNQDVYSGMSATDVKNTYNQAYAEAMASLSPEEKAILAGANQGAAKPTDTPKPTTAKPADTPKTADAPKPADTSAAKADAPKAAKEKAPKAETPKAEKPAKPAKPEKPAKVKQPKPAKVKPQKTTINPQTTGNTPKLVALNPTSENLMTDAGSVITELGLQGKEEFDQGIAIGKMLEQLRFAPLNEDTKKQKDRLLKAKALTDSWHTTQNGVPLNQDRSQTVTFVQKIDDKGNKYAEVLDEKTRQPIGTYNIKMIPNYYQNEGYVLVPDMDNPIK